MASQKMVMLKLSPDQRSALFLRASPPVFLVDQILKSSAEVITLNPLLTVCTARLYLLKTTKRYQLSFSRMAFVFRGKYDQQTYFTSVICRFGRRPWCCHPARRRLPSRLCIGQRRQTQLHSINLRIFRQCARNCAYVTKRPHHNQSQTAVNQRKPAHFPSLRLSRQALAGLWRNSFRATAGAVASCCSCSCTVAEALQFSCSQQPR